MNVTKVPASRAGALSTGLGKVTAGVSEWAFMFLARAWLSVAFMFLAFDKAVAYYFTQC